ncbi:MAG TPA: hypothetical protein VGG70_00715, partial [Candidatus Cybelea sp.]
QDYSATAIGNVLALYYVEGSIPNNLPFFVTSSVHLTLTAAAPPFFIGTVTLWGTPTTGETAYLTVGTTQYPLAETTGNTMAQQAGAWAASLNTTPPFDASYFANSSGAVVNIFATTAVSSAGTAISAVSSAHLQLTVYSELQNRIQFLQSITDVVEDEIPAQARWYLQSEHSQI